jgi:hypothetical protein
VGHQPRGGRADDLGAAGIGADTRPAADDLCNRIPLR